MEIGSWLRTLGLEQYEAAFRDNDVDAALLPSLTADDLRDLGVGSVGHRRRLLSAIAELGEQRTSASAEAAAPPEPGTNRAERRHLTVMFVDLVGSTELSRGLDPEDMSALIRAYQNTVAGEITRLEGLVAKYMGDGVLAYFGWPAAHEDEAERAIRAGLAITAAVAAMPSPKSHELRARVGIATGTVVVGDLIGEGAAREEAVVGETPNLAARLQERAGAGGVVIAVATRRLVGDLFRLRALGALTLKGFDRPAEAFAVLGEAATEGRFAALRAGRLGRLVGRTQELALLWERWSEARAGEGQVVQLLGEPGIGKSRLLEALRERLDEGAHTRIRYFCSPYHTSSALHPIKAQMVRAAELDRDEPAEAKLAKLERMAILAGQEPTLAVPPVAALLGIPGGDRFPSPDLTPRRQKSLLFEVLLDHLAGLAARQPVVIFYEDLQWIDPTTLELLDLLVGRIERQPILVIATCRPEWAPRWIGHPSCSLLTINRLSRAHAAAIVEDLTRGRELPEPVRAQILARTDGVPLFVEELTRAVLDSDLIDGRTAGLGLRGPLPPLAIPATLHDSLMARLDRLAPVKEVAQTGAVIGREFSFELLAALVSLTEDDLSDALGKLVAADLVLQRGTAPDSTYVFKHALVQDAAYESLLRSRRQVLHARSAQALEERFPDLVRAEPELVARHWANAAMPDKAITYWAMAGQAAVARSATTEAITHFRAALSEIANLPESAERDVQELAVQRAMGSAMVAAHGFAAPETGRAYERALELAERINDPRELFPVLYGLSLYYLYAAELDVARDIARRLIGLAESVGDSGLWFFAHRAAGVSAYPAGDLAAARDHLEQALALYDPTEHRAFTWAYAFDPRIVCLDYLARTLLPLGEIDAAIRCLDEELIEARRLNHRNSLCLSLFYGATLHQQLDDRVRVAALQAELAEIAEEERFPIWVAGAKILRGWLEVVSGAPGPGGDLIAEGIADWQSTGARLMLPYFGALLAEARAGDGRSGEAAALLREALRRAEETGERWFAAELHRRLAAILRGSGDVLRARDELAAAVDVARRQGALFWELRAAVDLAECPAAGDAGREASPLLESALRATEGCPAQPEHQRALALLRPGTA